ncbi:MAG: phosphonate metabolism protein/1,5-bisphosphokinase (PRPP-forming) PhnN [Hyphomicrobiales bacterium]|nr:phosphonate metabolism protein/1,5-bisphosphokinase (PRPP-forming) PhnN [Hyphomicrobiales bacterium]
MSSEGALILVVGPSGAGKDSILREARRAFESDHRIRFARRYITRSPDGNEHNYALTEPQFAAARRLGGFLLAWDAHGLNYGIPASVAIDLARGVSVIANASRSVTEVARAMWARTIIVQVSASPATLLERLKLRGREDDMAQRVERASGVPVDADVTISNDGDLAQAVDSIVALLRTTLDGAPVEVGCEPVK